MNTIADLESKVQYFRWVYVLVMIPSLYKICFSPEAPSSHVYRWLQSQIRCDNLLIGLLEW